MNNQNQQVDRVRMCVAEAGFSPKSITPITDPYLLEKGYVFYDDQGLLPVEVVWRAREIAQVGAPKCFVCTKLHRFEHEAEECRAVRRLEYDCSPQESKKEESFDSIEG